MMRKLMSTLGVMGVTIFMVELLICIFIDIPTWSMVIPLILAVLYIIYDTIYEKLDEERKWKLKNTKRLRDMGSR